MLFRTRCLRYPKLEGHFDGPFSFCGVFAVGCGLKVLLRLERNVNEPERKSAMPIMK